MVRCLRLHKLMIALKTPLSEQLDGLSVLITKLSYVFDRTYYCR